ncbi:hypothetical protein V8C37DRAFT_367420 [Trichoderma ceciliae]
MLLFAGSVLPWALLPSHTLSHASSWAIISSSSRLHSSPVFADTCGHPLLSTLVRNAKDGATGRMKACPSVPACWMGDGPNHTVFPMRLFRTECGHGHPALVTVPSILAPPIISLFVCVLFHRHSTAAVHVS